MKTHIFPHTDRAISPVVGVVLMVGIVVALGAVVGGAVLGIGTGVGDTTPQAQFDVVQNGGTVTITHKAGDTIDPTTITVNGQPGTDIFGTDPLQAGDSGTYTLNPDDTTITIISETGDTTAKIVEETITGPSRQIVTALNENFDDGSYTDTFENVPGGSTIGTKEVTTTDPVSEPNRFEMNIESPPSDGGDNGVQTIDAYQNTTDVSLDINRTGNTQTSWTIGVQETNFTTGELDSVYLQVQPSGTPGEQAVYLVEQDETGILNQQQVTSGLTRDEWKDVRFQINDNSVTATVNGDSTTMTTDKDHTQMNNRVVIGVVTQDTSPVEFAVDNVVVKTEEYEY